MGKFGYAEAFNRAIRLPKKKTTTRKSRKTNSGPSRSTRVSFKKPVSRTRTRTKKPYRKGKVVNSQLGGSQTFCMLKKKLYLKKGLKKIGQKNYDYTNGTQRMTSTVGKQGIYIPFKLCDAPELDRIFNHIDNVKIAQQMLLEYVSAEVKLVNASNCTAELVIYDIMAKNDIAKTAPTDFTWPDNLWAQGVIDEGGSSGDNTLIGSVPFASKAFCEFYNVKQVSRVMLAPGQSHNHIIKYRVNEWINKERYFWPSDSLVDSFNIRKLTVMPMFVFNGGLLNDSITKTQISFGQANINMFYKINYTYTWFQDKDTSFYKINTLPTAFTSGTAVVEDSFNSSAVNYATT